MTRYTYERRHAAHYAGRIITVPDQVAEDQKAFDGKAFPAIDAPGYPWNGNYTFDVGRARCSVSATSRRKAGAR